MEEKKYNFGSPEVQQFLGLSPKVSYLILNNMSSEKAIQPGHTKRYLPEKAWASLSKEERAKTDAKKKAGSKQGKQFVPNTEAAKKASKKARTPKKK